MRRALLIALIVAATEPVTAQMYSTAKVDAGSVFPVPLTAETTLVSFAPSQTGEFTVRAGDFEATPVVFILLGPDFRTLATNLNGAMPEAGLRFRAIAGVVFHIAIAVLDASDVGRTLRLQMAFDQPLPQSEVRFFYGSDLLK